MQWYVANKRFTSDRHKQWRNQKQCFKQRVAKKQKSGIAILLSDKIYFKLKVVKRDKVGQYLMIKRSILQTYSQFLKYLCT